MTGNRDPWHGLRANSLLQSLTGYDALQLAPLLERVSIKSGDTILQAGAVTTQVYFPETVVACLFSPYRAEKVKVGVIGREGMIGWSGLLGKGHSIHDGNVVMFDGTALTISAARLTDLCRRNPTLSNSLLCFIQTFSQQMSSTLASNLCDPLDRRLARLLLMLHDRVDGDQLAVTHQSLAVLLNARRAGVTDSTHVLEGDRVLRCSRGLITITDRQALEHAAGPAYGVAEQGYRVTIGPFGK